MIELPLSKVVTVHSNEFHLFFFWLRHYHKCTAMKPPAVIISCRIILELSNKFVYLIRTPANPILRAYTKTSSCYHKLISCKILLLTSKNFVYLICTPTNPILCAYTQKNRCLIGRFQVLCHTKTSSCYCTL